MLSHECQSRKLNPNTVLTGNTQTAAWINFKGQWVSKLWGNYWRKPFMANLICPWCVRIGQPVSRDTLPFLYADDLALTVQRTNSKEVEYKLNLALKNVACWNTIMRLDWNVIHQNVCAFHLKNRQARRRLDIIWDGVSLTHCEMPCHLGVTLDQMLTFKGHYCNLK